jgi:hypothetical protein
MIQRTKEGGSEDAEEMMDTLNKIWTRRRARKDNLTGAGTAEPASLAHSRHCQTELTMLMMQASCNMKRLVVSNGSSSSGWKKFTGHTSMNFTLDDLN